MSFIKDFKAFALKGNVMDLAVAVIIGAAFGAIVSSLVDDIITVTDQEVGDMTKRLALEQSLYVGYSSGANVMAAGKYPHLRP